jgi:hypothetical protein
MGSFDLAKIVLQKVFNKDYEDFNLIELNIYNFSNKVFIEHDNLD